jgi:FAD/FMN-containing dehydrogenase
MLQERTIGVVDALSVEALRAGLLGPLLTPRDAEYDTARRVWNKAYLRAPALIVRAMDSMDVLRSVAFARAHDLPLAIRSGGHSLAGFGSTDDGLVLDLSLLKRISIDPARGVAWVQPGVTSDELAPRAAEYGLGLSTGDAPTVGIGGLTLGGGIGFMVRKYGLTIDSLLSAEVVTANGRFITASPTQHPDLFWALRGGGGNFGVVTNLQFQLRPVGTVTGGAMVVPATPQSVRAYLDRAIAAPDGLTTITFLIKAPPLPFIPAALHGSIVLLILAVFVGDLEDGRKALDPLRTLAPGTVDVTGAMPYPNIFDFTRDATVSTYHYGRSTFVQDVPDHLVETLLRHMQHTTSPMSFVQIRPLGGAFAEVPTDATAFANRDKRYMLGLINGWDGSNAEAHCRWIDNLWQEVRPHGDGVYVNFLENGEGDRIRQAYPGDTYARLVAIKRRYDPDNFFRLNQNIIPD